MSEPPPAPIAPPPDLDPAALARLERLGGAPFVVRLLTLFGDEAPAKVAGVHASLAARDAAQLAYWAHSLISSASNLGAPTLWELARAIERAATAQQWDPLPDLVRALDAAHAGVQAALAREIAKRSAA
jgi:HPt (histidine-containing phosphotransfer) domain-containing protein